MGFIVKFLDRFSEPSSWVSLSVFGMMFGFNTEGAPEAIAQTAAGLSALIGIIMREKANKEK